MTSTPNRGEVWLVEFDPHIGAEISKARPAVVMSVSVVGRLPLRVVVPITDWKAQYASYLWFVPLLASIERGLLKDSGADAFQVKSLSLNRFVRKLGALTDEEMAEIAAAIALCVGHV